MKFTAALVVTLGALAVAAAVAVACGQGGGRAFGVPVMWLCAALAFLVNWIAFVPAFLLETERFYDLTGALTYLSVVTLAAVSVPGLDMVSLAMCVMVGVWAVRLGTFLFRRVHRDGGDSRFDEIKKSAPRFFIAWTLQGLWVFLTAAAALTAISATERSGASPVFVIGGAVWLLGFALEVLADRQKRIFKRNSANTGRFIVSGLWAYSRHPNYFGEIVLWTGVLIAAAPGLSGWQWTAAISPIFVTVLLTRVSGLPLLEARADARWGGQPDYEAYKARTSVLVPWPPSSASEPGV
jgi:steroid 5-alpha reductase family enzyme